MLTNFPRFVSVVIKKLLQEKLCFDSFEMLENWLTFAQLVAGQIQNKALNSEHLKGIKTSSHS